MRTRWLVMAMAPALLGAASTSVAPPLDSLAFMAGCWRGEMGDGTTIEETWTTADADVMLATTRYLQGERVVGWEFSRIHADSAGIHLTPYPDGEPRPAFDLQPSGEGMAIFRNDANDFPTNIIYRADGESGLVVRLEGGGRHMEVRMASGTCGR